MGSDVIENWGLMYGPRTVPAIDAMNAVLDDGNWHLLGDIVTAGMDASDVQRKWLCRVLNAMYRNGVLERRGTRPKRRYRRAESERSS